MKPKYSPATDHKQITDAILSVYDNADFSNKQALNKLTDPLINRCQGMSREMAIEALGKIGIAIVMGLVNPAGADQSN